MERMPVYVKIDEYKDVLDILSLVIEKVAEAKNLLDSVEEIKAEEDNEIEATKTSIDEIEEKIKFVDNSLFEPDM